MTAVVVLGDNSLLVPTLTTPAAVLLLLLSLLVLVLLSVGERCSGEDILVGEEDNRIRLLGSNSSDI